MRCHSSNNNKNTTIQIKIYDWQYLADVQIETALQANASVHWMVKTRPHRQYQSLPLLIFLSSKNAFILHCFFVIFSEDVHRETGKISFQLYDLGFFVRLLESDAR